MLMLMRRAQSPVDGFTLVEVLVLIGALSLFAMLYALSQPFISEERQAALTVSRTYDLMRGAHSYYNTNSLTWPTMSQLKTLLPSRTENQVNAFGERYYREIEDGSFTLYQLVPKQWANYIDNHLEKTSILTVDMALAGPLSNEPELANLYGRGYVGIKTSIDRYGNLLPAFERRQFSSSRELLDPNNSRMSPENGTTTALIPKPDCGKDPFGNAREAVISYIIRGVCSFYPRYYYDPKVYQEMNDSDSTKNLDEAFWYTTQGFRTRLTSTSIDDKPFWQISLQAHERWYKVEPTTYVDAEGNTVPDTNFIPTYTWSASQEFCDVNTNKAYKDQDLDKQANPRIANSEFFKEDSLLYVDAWVSCK